MRENLKQQIIDAAKLLACTPESDATGTPEVMRYKIHALIEACENLVRDNAEIIEWVKVADEMPVAFDNVLIFGKQADSDSTSHTWTGWFDDDGYIWLTYTGNEIESVSHWAPMPKGPEI